jgi:hypothetical protein
MITGLWRFRPDPAAPRNEATIMVSIASSNAF